MKKQLIILGLVFLAVLSVISLTQAEVLIERGSEWKYFKGTGQPVSAKYSWWDTRFTDSTWANSTAPFRYGDGQGGTLLRNMQRRYSSLFLRRTFETKDSTAFSVLDLNVNFDDGFKVWINAKPVLSVNAPDNPIYSSLATQTHESGQFESFEISDINSFLKNGTNTIAIQAFNLSLASSDFLVDAELVGIPEDFEEPKLISVSPKPGTVSALKTVTVRFSEPVRGVDYDDFLLNGRSADNVQGSDDTWVFTFLDVGYGNVELTWADGHEIGDFARPANTFDAVSADGLGPYQVVDNTAPELVEVMPPPDGIVRELSRLKVFFSEPIVGFDIRDIRINGQPPQTVTGFADGPWEVEFNEIKSGKVNVTWMDHHGITDSASKPNAFQANIWSYSVDTDHSPGNIVISEFLASNYSGLKDEDGQAADWIELQNTGRSTVNLAGWSLTDEKGNPGKWVFPAVNIGAGDYLMVFASGKNRRNSTNELHTNFKLGSKGNYLGLFSSELPRQTVDKISSKYSEQRNNVSFGLAKYGEYAYFTKPTPGAQNGVGIFKDILAKPKFSKKRGFFYEPFRLEIASQEPNAVIRYTIDFSEP
ncbi:MAG TPA: lamin tail domain-containing protein, partial [Rhodospirillales bacterium]|nr:lamin tail domain-containing protein [Rhodospirillales bacterium]